MNRSRIIGVLVLLCAALPLWSQPQRENSGRSRAPQGVLRLAASSVDPEADSLAILKMRHRMDSIRTSQGRPTVALVLSGGGAKGAAHVSVLKYLEEQQVPIDMILGTSMGGLVGGLYALGYTAAELDTLLRGMDWDKALSDRINQDYVPYAKKMRQQRYLISLPFHYSKEDFAAKVGEGVLASARRRGLDLSAAQEEDLINGAAASTSFNSLPAGFAYGVNVNNIIASKTVGYQDSLDFSTLPIPFFCVAADMVSCKAKYWTSGPLNTAMRSTMSIPVLFEPVRYQDMILIDGGTRNNYPTDLARAMGADVIIGVVLADADLSYAQINNIMDMVMQVTEMLGREAYSGNVHHTDVIIRPDMTGYGMLSFGKEEIDTILNRGYEGALKVSEKIAGLKSRTGSAVTVLQAPKAVDITRSKVRIAGFEFSGVDEDDARYLRREVRIKEGDEAGSDEIEEAVCRLFAMDAFESVNYTLTQADEGYVLTFNCNKGPVHRIGAAGRADTEEMVAAMINVGLNVNKLRGSRWDFEGRFGNHWYGKVKYSYTAPLFPTLNIEASGGYTNARILRGDYRYQTGFSSYVADAFLSGMRLENFDFRTGLKFERFAVDSWLTDSGQSVPKDQMQLLSSSFGSLYAKLRHYTPDDLYFPSRGINVGVDMQWLPWNQGTKMLGMDFSTVINLNSFLALLPRFCMRTVIDPAGDNLFLSNYAGGTIRGRYLDTQMSFVGFNHLIPVRNFGMVVSMDLRARLLKDVYATLQGGFLSDNDGFPTEWKSLSPTYLGAAAELSYDSLIGPVRARLQWSDFHGWSAYAGIGFDF